MVPKAVSVHRKSVNGDCILVGTRGGEILEVNTITGVPVVYLRNHFEGPLQGLAIHPKKAEVFTFGQDGLLAQWDLHNRRQIRYAKLDTPGDVVTYSNSGDYLVIGMENGSIIVLDSKMKPVAKRVDRHGQKITCIKFSPNDYVCAVGATD